MSVPRSRLARNTSRRARKPPSAASERAPEPSGTSRSPPLLRCILRALTAHLLPSESSPGTGRSKTCLWCWCKRPRCQLFVLTPAETRRDTKTEPNPPTLTYASKYVDNATMPAHANSLALVNDNMPSLRNNCTPFQRTLGSAPLRYT